MRTALLLLALIALFLSACTVVAPAPPTMPTSQTIQGEFQLQSITLDTNPFGVVLPECADSKMGRFGLYGDGFLTGTGEGTLTLTECYDRLLGQREGTGTFRAASGEVLHFHYTGWPANPGHMLPFARNFSVVSGRGKYTDAAGEGTIKYVQSSPTREYHEFEVTGTLVTQRWQGEYSP